MRILLTGAALAVGLAVTPARADYFIANDESFSYIGTVTAPDGTHYSIPSFVSTPGTTTYPGRDASVYLSSNAPTVDTGAGYENYTFFQTNWYSSLDGQNDGINPQDTDTGFISLLDGTNASVTSASGGWTDGSYTTFSLTITGAADTPLYNRFWAPPEVGGAGDDTAGVFLDYSLTLTETFAPGDVTEEAPGWYSTTEAPTGVTGSLTGSFQNQAANSALNGIYNFNLSFTGTNWAANNAIPDVYGPYTGASQVPEPSSLALLTAGLLGFGIGRWRKAGARGGGGAIFSPVDAR